MTRRTTDADRAVTPERSRSAGSRRSPGASLAAPALTDGAAPRSADVRTPGEPAADHEALVALCSGLLDALALDGVAVRRDVGSRLASADSDSAGVVVAARGAPAGDPWSEHLLSTPLTARGHRWGTLDLHRAGGHGWTEADRTLARHVAEAAAGILALAAERDAYARAWRAAEHTATHDGLTGLPNRGLLFDRLEHAIAHAVRHGRAVAVLFVDVDGFKTVNDRFGHAVGDATLVEIAHRLSTTLRASDTLARLAGDEFVVVCEDLTPSGSAHRWLSRLAERILHEVRREPLPGEPELRVTVSIGAAVTRRECSPEHLTDLADAAMYAAKRSGGGRLVVNRGRPVPRRRTGPVS